ncbi:phosphoenolpyruvate synthase [Candidatus Woesebacteria bacterium RIFCSPHIGHO2_01_FULL_39_17]|uniref:Phosphoenolpyruvate synthase n=3 Tax=Candidatus Woeseibacteriota TaxID=1752722 RepID=A0A0G0QVC5_9BACT|nr:MAG: Phosphoenolpyruvate synthase [Microgenomates group bacterium GW2011_GWC1_38_12]KKQ94231.1 MAG: Phosphoenolpyruvate synthase [Candidatus Woesebacteria bacterium GW2011_GWB1_39_10b]KKR14295.1 MAG: Phosphoenolpyruvate synthase [Candidatus Woesebacteria bacterium GW2011_GWA1_39_21b]OGM23633.1 MAG: phosphoenolpyruvate synthase [Candidatus Woesebacteria bacterium RIFCSPHIGHO2_01_FULL_39_17]OGM65456.1 MAG: phosphoenolpyruvate synthase [Candidatus Woesebacteria bacterium RIFCSPLOWO2_01_FULL_39_
MAAQQPLIKFFKDIDKDDIPSVGGKGANLGEMTQASFPVPPGFAITVSAYDAFLEKNQISKKINDLIEKTDINEAEQLQEASKRIEKIITTSLIPEEVSRDVIQAYKKLSGIFKSALVAVRSSATAEDLPGASFAGQQATFLNVKGDANLLVAVRDCWASLFTARAIFYREQNKISHSKVKISVIVQKMIQSEVSGVMFSIDPVTSDKDRIVIESVWGLGEMIVQGSVVPDRYVVQKDTFSILSKEISDQKIQLIKKGGKNIESGVPERLSDKPKLNDNEIIKLAKLAERLQKHYYFPQDIEWAKDGQNLYIVQTRPVTALGKAGETKVTIDITDDKKIKIAEVPVLTGVGASPGIGTGPVKVLSSPKEINKVKNKDVLVAPMTSPDYVPAMKKASAIITDEGGMTSHAAIVSRELGIPCVVGTKEATKRLKDETVVTVDGERGLIYLGGKIKIEKKEVVEEEIKGKTATKLYINLAEKELAVEMSKLNVDGVGLLRAEFMIANIGIHPKEAIKKKTQGHFVEKLANDLETFCKAFYPRPVVYRATDFKTNEYRSLPGGANWEPIEPNPMLGFRGAFRYIASPDVFNLELTAIKKVRDKYKNLWLMVPFVRSPEELSQVRRLVAAEGLFASTTFKFWMMVEIPTNVILIEEFIKVGIDGVSIGSNDLTMLLTGTDRDNAEVASAFNERSPVVNWSLRRVIKKCNKHGVTSSICGQAPSEYEDLVKKLVKYGITSISVNPDAVNTTRKVIMEAEKEVVDKL